MCRSAAEGGRRCPGSSAGGSSPPADGKTRIEVHTNKRSYSVVGGESKVMWMPGEKVVSMDVIKQDAAAAEEEDTDPGGDAPVLYRNEEAAARREQYLRDMQDPDKAREIRDDQ